MKTFAAYFGCVICTALCTLSLTAQVPDKMSYQAVLRDASNHLLSNQTVGLRIAILRDGPTGAEVYAETHTVTTNTNGLVTLEIGGGTVVVGSFDSIDWSAGTYFLKVEWDPDGGTDYTLSHSGQLLSVPYAFLARNAAITDNDDNDPTNELQTLSIVGNQLSISRGNTVTIPTGAQKVDDLLDGKTDSSGSSNFIGYKAGEKDDGTENNNTALGYQALANNTSGSHNTALGASTLQWNSTGTSNTAIGIEALHPNTRGSNNIAIGYRAITARTTSSNNLAIGNISLFRITKDGTNNTGIGEASLYSNTSGKGNTAIGPNTLAHNTTGENNTAIGYFTLGENTQGSKNTAIGSLQSNVDGSGNTALGVNALDSNRHGSFNTAYGSYALHAYDSFGKSNTAVGANAMTLNKIHGNYNTAIGHLSGKSNDTCNNSTSIGYNTTPISSNRIHIGNTSVTWIGGQVAWSTYSDQRIKRNISDDVHGLDFILRLRPVTYYIDKDLQDSLMGVTDNADYLAKHDIEKIRFSGFLAQEVEAAARAVGYDFSGLQRPANDRELYSLSYASFVVPLVKAVQEQQAIISRQRDLLEELTVDEERLSTLLQNQTSKIQSLEGKNTVLRKELKQQEEKIQKQKDHIQSLQDKRKDISSRIATLQDLMRHRQQRLHQLTHHIRLLQAELNHYTAQNSQGDDTTQNRNQ